MKARHFTLALLVVLSAAATQARALTVYVSPEGKDAWSGRLAEANSSSGAPGAI